MRHTLLLTLLLCLVLAPAAQAGKYDVVAGEAATGDVNRSWDVVNARPDLLAAGDALTDTGDHAGLYVRPWLGRDFPTYPNPDNTAAAAWRFRAPAGATISRLTYKRWLYKKDIEDWKPETKADGTVLETCSVVYPAYTCDVGSNTGTAERTFSGLNAQQLTVGARCAAPDTATCPGGYSLYGLSTVVYEARVTLSEFGAPSVGAPVASGLWSGAAWHASSGESVTFAASDTTSGVRQARLYVDGQLARVQTFDCDFTYKRPCADRPAVSLAPSLSLANGPHTIQVAAVDAAGNETRGATKTIVADGDPPSAPVGMSATREGSAVTVRWSNPAEQVSPISLARVQLCQDRSCQPASSVVGQQATLTLPGPGRWTVRVWLRDEAGWENSAAWSAAAVELPASPNAPAPTTPSPDVPVATPPATKPPPAPTANAPRASARLRIVRARRRAGTLRASGTITEQATGRLSLSYRVRHGARALIVRGRATIRAGHWSAQLRLPRSLTGSRRGALTVRFAGTSTVAADQAQLTR